MNKEVAIPLARALVKAGADLDRANKLRDSALTSASAFESGCLELMKLLLFAGTCAEAACGLVVEPRGQCSGLEYPTNILLSRLHSTIIRTYADVPHYDDS